MKTWLENAQTRLRLNNSDRFTPEDFKYRDSNADTSDGDQYTFIKYLLSVQKSKNKQSLEEALKCLKGSKWLRSSIEKHSLFSDVCVDFPGIGKCNYLLYLTARYNHANLLNYILDKVSGAQTKESFKMLFELMAIQGYTGTAKFLVRKVDKFLEKDPKDAQELASYVHDYAVKTAFANNERAAALYMTYVVNVLESKYNKNTNNALILALETKLSNSLLDRAISSFASEKAIAPLFCVCKKWSESLDNIIELIEFQPDASRLVLASLIGSKCEVDSYTSKYAELPRFFAKLVENEVTYDANEVSHVPGQKNWLSILNFLDTPYIAESIL